MISGSTICLNVFQRDYCFEASLRSLLSFCDEVVVVDGGSNDGTVEFVESLKDERIKLLHMKVEPVSGGGPKWLRDWAEFARSKCSGDMHVNLQADEVFHEDHVKHVKDAAKLGHSTVFHRYNFWLDSSHLLPPNHGIVNDWVLRLAPQSNPFQVGGDAESLHGDNPQISWLGIFHYGFIRNAKGFVEKSRLMQQSILGMCDPVIDKIEDAGMACLSEKFSMDKLVKFSGTHPSFVQPWLNSH